MNTKPNEPRHKFQLSIYGVCAHPLGSDVPRCGLPRDNAIHQDVTGARERLRVFTEGDYSIIAQSNDGDSTKDRDITGDVEDLLQSVEGRSEVK